MKTMSTKLTIKDFSVFYGNFRAVREINLEIPANHITAIIGPSGCGKSTFLRAFNRMNDLIPNTHVDGKVILDGQNLFDIDVVELRRRVGMVFQKPNPFPKTIYDNVAYGPRAHGLRDRVKLDEIVERSLRDAALWDEVKDIMNKSGLALSGGQQQRLCIARALAVEPEVLLCDEATSALDPISAQGIEEQLCSIKVDTTIVMVTHALRQARRLADHVIFLWMGELVETGSAVQFFDAPRDERSQAYLAGDIG